MDKEVLLKEIIAALEFNYQKSVEAAMRAYNTATDDENVAENKYDTLALEASYLAHGQAQRVAECEADICAFKGLSQSVKSAGSKVVLGSLVELIDQEDRSRYLFLGPSAGGLKLTFAQNEVVIVTPGSPLGNAIIHRELHEQLSVQVGGQLMDYEIAMIS